ncbi:sensor histidine kinase [Mucilaginibacter sp. OK098]|uniref:sensor histidine kinase n=1 Tax=Mucilaginibacter sp. OK098 TaxID=1855297 RepID=UPI00091F938F|nr:histidine kinase [Mucilaginibacter sp. OK098]SHN12660.1 Histidine kinase [Mucilaginibacter sp. OK098]
MNLLKTFWDRSFTDWRYRVLLHAGFWFFLFFFWMEESVTLRITLQQHYSVTLVGIGYSLFLFYPFVYVIVPLLQKHEWLYAFLLFLIYYVIAIVLRTYEVTLIVNWYNLKQTWVVGNDFWKRVYGAHFSPIGLSKVFFSSITSLFEVIYIPLAIKFIRYAYQFNIKQAWLAKENTQLQLSTLKAQINPHFFFNTLNNLQSFIVQNEKEKSVDLLNRLADFMRSSLYDCEAEQISMMQEITLLNNYIAIERIRFDEQANISIQLTDKDPDYKIPPFIFLPFVENAFKHGGSLATDQIFIEISLQNTTEKITLKTKNSYHNDHSKGGIGLQNIKKRLVYYFPENFTLNIDKTGDFYSVILEICKPLTT